MVVKGGASRNLSDHAVQSIGWSPLTADILAPVKRLLISLLRGSLRPFRWDVAPAPVLDQERNNTAVMKALARSLAERVRAEFERRGLDASPQWLEGIRHELQFWVAHFATEGIEYGGRAVIDNLVRPHPFQYESLFGEAPARLTISVLDVGAGPLSQIGTLSTRLGVSLRAVDPLAPAYDAILALFGLVPPVATEFGVGERLVGQFPEQSFDLAHARNALDHAMDPLRCIQEMAALVKPGGWIVLDHADREGDHQAFQGMHQWNFEVVGRHYCIEDTRGRRRVFEHDAQGFAMTVEQYIEGTKQFSRVFYRRRSR